MRGVSKAVAVVRQHFEGPIRIAELARVAGMSLSTFHQHLKALTGLSPISISEAAAAL